MCACESFANGLKAYAREIVSKLNMFYDVQGDVEASFL